MKNSKMRLLLTGTLGFLLLGGLPGQGDNVYTLRIVFAGDIMGHDSQIEAARVEKANRVKSPAKSGSPDSLVSMKPASPADTEEATGRYDYSRCFRNLVPYLDKADIAVGNLELTLAGPPYKGYPRFSSPDELGDALRDAGFDVLVNANNHALDRGKEGLERTVGMLGEKGTIQTGVFISPDQRELRYPLILEKNGILLALLNYTYGTNSLTPDTPNVINYLDTVLIRQDIRKARLVDPDFIIAIVHWGQEYQREENAVQQSLARFLFEQGADAVIGSHPHVIQPIRYERDGDRIVRPVVYSLGNFVSNQRNRYRNGGIIVGLNLEKKDRPGNPAEDGYDPGPGNQDLTRITGIDYLPVYVHKPREGERYVFELVPGGIPDDSISGMGFTGEEKASYLEFCEDTGKHLANVPPAAITPEPE